MPEEDDFLRFVFRRGEQLHPLEWHVDFDAFSNRR